MKIVKAKQSQNTPQKKSLTYQLKLSVKDNKPTKNLGEFLKCGNMNIKNHMFFLVKFC